jgi:hypothetical protein
MNHRKWAGLAPWLFLFVATGAYANMGIPMLMLAWPAYILGLIPVIAIEAFIGTRMLKLSWNDVLPATAIGNIWSTLVGIPVVWIALIALEAAAGIGLSTIDPSGILQWVLFPFFVAWLAPTESIWVVYAAFVVLAIPFCVASI